jgi:hypothetical protein
MTTSHFRERFGSAAARIRVGDALQRLLYYRSSTLEKSALRKNLTGSPFLLGLLEGVL